MPKATPLTTLVCVAGRVESQTMESRARMEFTAGLRDSLPLMVSVAAYGLIWGALARQAGLLPLEVAAMSVIVASGSAQFVAVPMITAGASAGLVLLTTYVISLRHYLMAASLAPAVQQLPRWAQALMAYGINDESYALTIARWREHSPHVAYFFGSASGMYGAWFSSTTAGGVLGIAIREPERYGLDFAFPAVFLALLLSQLRDRKALAVAVLSGALALIFAHLLPGKWHIVVAALGASFAGALLERGR